MTEAITTPTTTYIDDETGNRSGLVETSPSMTTHNSLFISYNNQNSACNMSSPLCLNRKNTSGNNFGILIIINKLLLQDHLINGIYLIIMLI